MSNETIVIGNLPYNISTQILIKFLKLNPWPPKFIKMIFMFQKEVGEKIIANFGSKEYSRLSIITKSRLRILNYFYVSKNCFIPKPKVNSSVVKIVPLKNNPNKFKFEDIEKITQLTFSRRRKMLRTIFKNYGGINMLNETGISPNLRPENLTIEEYCKLAKKIF